MLEFYPLYWIYHDTWKWKETTKGSPENSEKVYNHAGHVHLFMMDFNPLKQATQQAYSGTQTYSFSIEDKWGPNSTRKDQIESYRLVGKPIWFFTIEEYWRRMYIQPWDIEDHSLKMPNHEDRIGIKYDASKECHSFGPFREGRGLYFFNPKVNRTLPVEYWLDKKKTRRQHYLRKRHYQNGDEGIYSWDDTPGGQEWSFEERNETWYRHPKGHEWRGDNAKYSDSPYPTGFYEKDDIVCVRSLNGSKSFYRNTLTHSMPMPSSGGSYLPNPKPNSSESEFRLEYLRYYGMNFSYHGEYSNGEKFVIEFSRWKQGKDGTEQSLFDQFVSEKQRELIGICFGGYFEGWRFIEPTSYENLRYEYISFSDFKEIWTKLSKEEAINLDLYGSYPILREDYDPDDWSENRYDETYHNQNGDQVNPFEEYKNVFSHRDVYTIPRESICKGDMVQDSNGLPNFTASLSDEDGARRMYSDNLYISPIIEYQTVTHLIDQRLPESETADKGIDIWTDESGAFGDGFKMNVEIPFKINGMVQSPFSDDTKKVYPIGMYFHGKVKDSSKFRYSFETYGEETDIEKIRKYDEDLEKWRSKKDEANSSGAEFNEKEPEGPFSLVKKYRLAEYNEFMSSEHTPEEKVEWFNTKYANRPIVHNYEEGKFINDNWIPVVTNCMPDDSQVEHDEIGPIIRRKNEHGEYEEALKDVEFNLNGYKEDGIWVEQCLGAKVTPKVMLVFEDALGHRWVEYVTNIQSESSTEFVGK